MLTNYFSNADNISFFERVLFIATGQNLTVDEYTFTGGGCINQSIKITAGSDTFFLKWNESDAEDMFACEARGLHLLQQNSRFKVPEVLGRGKIYDKHFLLLEFLSATAENAAFTRNFGQYLAEMHGQSTTAFGLDHHNYIGTLPQINDWQSSAAAFFIECRLKPMAGRAFYEEKLTLDEYKRFDTLYQQLPNLLPDEPPALLHGDLWSGNIMPVAGSTPALFDPAVAYGLRESELAFTQLFGGIDYAFMHTYQEVFPLQPGFEERIALYNLYPLLVHLILFGEGYKTTILSTLKRFV